ncbi:HEPN domain-containing protein [Ferroglobus placidus]|nr:HEPN domain-containing protein [Ferroglobus placidus]
MAERSLDWIRQARRDVEMAEYATKSGFYECPALPLSKLPKKR